MTNGEILGDINIGGRHTFDLQSHLKLFSPLMDIFILSILPVGTCGNKLERKKQANGVGE
jgi:hypothetical protein